MVAVLLVLHVGAIRWAETCDFARRPYPDQFAARIDRDILLPKAEIACRAGTLLPDHPIELRTNSF